VAIERANALVMAVLSGLLKRKRSVEAALMYILALGRDVRANCWDLAEKAGLEPGDGRFHRLLEPSQQETCQGHWGSGWESGLDDGKGQVVVRVTGGDRVAGAGGRRMGCGE
jgi:hypothetical protein